MTSNYSYRYYYLFIFLFVTLNLHGQNLDSIYIGLQNRDIDTSYLKKSILVLLNDQIVGSSKGDSLIAVTLSKCQEKKFTLGIGLIHRYYANASFKKGDIKNSISQLKKSIICFEQVEDSTYTPSANQALGVAYFNSGNQDSAIYYCSRAIKSFQSRDSKKNLAFLFNTMGGIYWSKGNYNQAAEEFFKSLKIKEQLNDSIGIANTYNNIGILFDSQGKLSEALDMYYKSLDIYQKKKNNRGIGRATNNIAIVLKNQSRNGEAIEMFLRSLEIDKQIGNINEQGKTLNNIGELYIQMNEPKRSISFLNEAYQIFNSSGDNNGKTATVINLGKAYMILGDNAKASTFFENGIKLAQKDKLIEWVKESYYNFYLLNKKTRNKAKALTYFEKYTTINDSLRSLENLNKLDELKVKFETEQKEKEILILSKENDLKNLTIKKQQSITLFFISITCLTLLIAFLVGYGWIKIRKDNQELLQKNTEINQQKEEIETQRDLLESLNTKLNQQNQEIENQFEQVESLNIELNQQKEEILAQRDQIEFKNMIITATNRRLTENIEYAARIQKALLPDLNITKRYFTNHSILYLPKDIVSGDFYWMWAFEDRLCFSVADCTGHGVSGAFMSILAYNLLKDSVITLGLTNPKDIVTFIYNEIENNFYSNLPLHEIKDGLDLVVCNYYPKKNILEYSGAHSSFIHLTSKSLNLLKTDRYTIGSRIKQNVSFTNNQVELKKGDRLFLFTDGYMDQLDSIKRRKIGRNEFYRIIESSVNLNVNAQIQELQRFLNTWMINSEQTDDILVWGIEI